MKKLILILPALLMLGCSVQQDCCETDSHQCDEFYPYYNCPDPVVGYYYRDYKRTWSNSSTSGYSSYYPNTQTVYYVPVQEPVTPPVNSGNVLYNTRRPERLGAMGEKQKTPRKDVYGNTLQPGDYPTRGASGQREIGNLNKPNAPKTTRE
tara:strand:- start:1732 stop:2184 length:453 start_codon:yes stop_codon:yes gene_type:complete